MTTGNLIVFSAPSGAGKSTIISRVFKSMDNLTFSVSATTRSIRNNEKDGVDYDYLTHDEFMHGVEAGDFIEYEEVHGQYYGTRKSRIEKDLNEGKDVVFDLDVLGALSIKRVYPEALLIYIDVLSKDVLKERLINRGREGSEEIEKRLQRYDFEKEKTSQFDRVVLNDNLETAVSEVIDIIKQQRQGTLEVARGS